MKKTFEIMRLTAAVLIILTVFTACRTGSVTDEAPIGSTLYETQVSANGSLQSAEQTVTVDTELEKPPIAQNWQWNPYCFDLLGNEYRVSAQKIADAIMNYEPSVALEAGEAEAVCANIAFEFPPAALADFTVRGNEVEISYLYDRETHEEKLNAFKSSVETVLNSLLEPEDNEIVRALLLYRYVAENVNYFTVDYTEKQITAFSALTDHVTICYGFADAFAYLLRQTGMEAHVYRGSSGGGEHGWCYAKAEGQWYHFDPTWEHSDQKKSGTASLIYFGMSDSRRYGGVNRRCVYGFGILEQSGENSNAPCQLIDPALYPCYGWRYDRTSGKLICQTGSVLLSAKQTGEPT